jgi:hypothetical protein
MKIQLLNVRIAGIPTFIPAANGDVNKHHTLMTVICNRGQNRNTQEEMSDEITLNFWGKYACTAALYLNKGREISVDGELRSYRHQTGQMRPGTNTPAIERRVEVLVQRFFFGKDSMKEMSARLNQKIAELKAAGRIPAATVLTAEELLAIERPAAVDYNPAVALQTGVYGNAKVWIKGTGFVTGNGVAAPVLADPAAAAGAGLDPAAMANQIAILQKTLLGLSAGAGAGGAATIDPFPT